MRTYMHVPRSLDRVPLRQHAVVPTANGFPPPDYRPSPDCMIAHTLISGQSRFSRCMQQRKPSIRLLSSA